MLTTIGFLEGVMLGLVALMVLGLLLGWLTAQAARPHDPRMNFPQMVATVWARWLDHKEREQHHIEALKQPVQRVELVEPVPMRQLGAPEVIEGVVVYSEAEMRAAKRIAQSRAMEVGKK